MDASEQTGMFPNLAWILDVFASFNRIYCCRHCEYTQFDRISMDTYVYIVEAGF